jgi:glycosyltransferase involved in cell wall biosynthesis
VLRSLELVLPGDPETRTGGYEYDRRIARGLREIGWTVNVHALAASFPAPDAAALADARARLAALPDGALVLVDGLAFGAMPEIAAREQRRLRLVALVHHPLALESGLAASIRSQLYASERAALAAVRGVIVTSERTARDLGAYGVARGRIAVVEPGTERAPLACGSAPGEPAALLCVATLTPRKGHDLLLDALASLRDREWRLDCIGDDRRDFATARRVKEQAARLDIGQRVRWAGAVGEAELAAAYAAADVFVLAARHEGYGMAVAEALARGIPVVTTSVGALPELVGDAGLVVPPEDTPALGAALRRMLVDAGLRARCAAAAAGARERLVGWAEASARFARALDSIAGEGAGR